MASGAVEREEGRRSWSFGEREGRDLELLSSTLLPLDLFLFQPFELIFRWMFTGGP